MSRKVHTSCTPLHAGAILAAPGDACYDARTSTKDFTMTFSMYAASVPVFRQILTALSAVLDKAEAYAADKKIEPAALLQARLFPDMFPLARQVQVAADFAKGACARLAGVDVPKYDDVESTFAELRTRIATTLAFIATLDQEAIAGSAERAITTGSGEKTRHFTGQEYLMHYAYPHFYFHATTAYDILRHNGVEVGKKDFVGSYK
jgi:hypothetical protein